MNLHELTIWCCENPRTAASMIQHLENQIKQLKGNPFPDDCIMHDCHECRKTAAECSSPK